MVHTKQPQQQIFISAHINSFQIHSLQRRIDERLRSQAFISISFAIFQRYRS